nr:MAK10-like protein [Tanacetum cinerariifolium]
MINPPSLAYTTLQRFATRCTIDHAAAGKLREKHFEESWELIEDLSLYDNESWNDPRDLAKPVKTISFPQDVLSTSECRLIKLENQVQRLMEAHLTPKPSAQVNKIASSCEM